MRAIRRLTFLVALLTLGLGAEAHTNCSYVLINSSGGKNKLRVCVSPHGNLVEFQSPEGHDPLWGEGYVVCSAGHAAPGLAHGWDAGTVPDPTSFTTVESGFGPATKTSSSPLTIRRATEDGAFQLTQSFTADAIEKSVTITMTLKNVSPGTLHEVTLVRYAAAILDDPGVPDVYDGTLDSVWVRDLHGLSLTAATYGTAHRVTFEDANDWFGPFGGSLEGCIPDHEPTLPDTGGLHNVGWVLYHLGSLPSDASRTVRVVYRRL